MSNVRTRRQAKLSLAQENDRQVHAESGSDNDMLYETGVDSECESFCEPLTSGHDSMHMCHDEADITTGSVNANEVDDESCPELQYATQDDSGDDERKSAVSTPATVINAPCSLPIIATSLADPCLAEHKSHCTTFSEPLHLQPSPSGMPMLYSVNRCTTNTLTTDSNARSAYSFAGTRVGCACHETLC